LLAFSADTDPKLRDALNSQNKTAFNICKNPPTKLGFRIIWKAAKEGDLDMVRILIREGADINAVTQDLRNSPLHLAAQNGHILIVKYLLELQADQ
jgi:ankyrin repeat protein